MSVASVFRSVVQSDLERIPLLEALHVEHVDGRDYLFSQVVVKNVLTGFDRLLSRHLAATRGTGFPSFTVLGRFRDRREQGAWHDREPGHHASMPHALRAIADRAVSRGNGGGILLRHVGREGPDGPRLALGREDVLALDDALFVCEQIGEADFLQISGDFDTVLAAPSADLAPVTMHLRQGLVTVPGTDDGREGSHSCPLAGFGRSVAEDTGIRAYVTAARHGLCAAKEAAVDAFRGAAEDQIMRFDRALGGRGLDGHRFEAATSLVTRLKAGLGEDLRGISAAARITALEWSMTLEEARPELRLAAASP